MIINTFGKKILKAIYGIDKKIDVTELIKININKFIILNNNFIGTDPDRNKKKILIIYFDDNSEIIVKENTKFIIMNINNFDWEFYLDYYKDLRKNGIKNEDQAITHYLNHGKKEKRIINKNMIKKNKEFDWEFYTNFYCDLNNIDNYNDAYNHYLKFGEKEKRIYSKKNLENIYKQNFNNEISKLDNYNCISKHENNINIILRTHTKKTNFITSLNSILNQNYHNYKIHITYDHPDSDQYVNEYNNDKIIKYKMIKKSNGDAYFDLYCNEIINKINDGYIMILDDDNYFINNNCLNIINNNLIDNINENKILVWNFLRYDKIIKPNINYLKYGEIDNNSYIFHNSIKNDSEFKDYYGSDFLFISKLISKNSCKYIDYTFISTQYNNSNNNYSNYIKSEMDVYKNVNYLLDNHENLYNKCSNYVKKTKIKSICTMSTKNNLVELKLLLLSINNYHKDFNVYIICDNYISEYLNNHLNNYPNLNIKKYNKLSIPKYKNISSSFQQEHDKKNIWIDFMLEKTTIMDIALEENVNTLFLDSDIVLLEELPLVSNNELILSIHNTNYDNHKQFGIFNGGCVYTSNKEFPKWWRNYTYQLQETDNFMEQGTLRYSFNFTTDVGLFDYGFNFGYWRPTLQYSNINEMNSYYYIKNNKLYFKDNSIKSIHTHFFTNCDYDHEKQLVLPFNKNIIDNYSIISKLKSPENNKICNYIINNQKNLLNKDILSLYSNKFKIDGNIVFVCDNGLTNRIFILFNALMLSEIYQTKVYVYWDINNTCECSFYDLFYDIENIEIINTIQFIDIILNYDINHLSTRNIEELNYKEYILEYYKNYNFEIIHEDIDQDDLMNLLKLNKINIISTYYYFYKFIDKNKVKELFRKIKINDNIINKFKSINSKLNINKSVKGIHLRYTDHSYIQNNLDIKNLIFNDIVKIIKNDNSQKFYIASDDNNVKKEFYDKFNDNIIYYKTEEFNELEYSKWGSEFELNSINRSKKSTIDGFIEFLLLNETMFTYPTATSTYSILISLLQDCEQKWFKDGSKVKKSKYFEMKNNMNFCCLVTKSHIKYIKSTFNSLLKQNNNYKLYLLVIDDDYIDIDIKNTIKIKLSNILNSNIEIINNIYKKYKNYKRIGDDEMRKNNPMDILRYSMKVCLIYYLLNYCNLDNIIWIDPDLYFTKNIDNIFKILHEKEVVLTPHFRDTINESNRHLIYRDGFFNCGFIGFKKGSTCLEWYINQIYLTCDLIDGFYYYEQKYLDYFPVLSDNIEILRNGTYNLSEWNMNICKRVIIDNKLYIQKDDNYNEPVFFHFTNYYINEIINKNLENDIIKKYLNIYLNNLSTD